MKKRICSLLLVLILVCGFVAAGAVPVQAAEAGTMMSNAINIVFGNQYTKSWTKSTDHLNHYNKITLTERGIITITATKPFDSEGEYGRMYFTLYDEAGDPIWGNDTYGHKDDAKDKYVLYVGLDAGVYYLTLKPGFYIRSGNITTKYSIDFKADQYCEIEPNGSAKNATYMEIGHLYIGHFGAGGSDYEEKDYYMFEVKAGHTYHIRMHDYDVLDPTTTIVELIMPGKTAESISYSWAEYVDGERINYYPVTAKTSGTAYIYFDNYSAAQYTYHIDILDQTCAQKGHSYGTWKVEKVATCMQEGTQVRTCTGCGIKETKTIARVDHQYENVQYVDQISHKGTCTFCGKEEIVAHTWNNGKVTTAPTCKDEGVKTYTCTACSATKTESVDKTENHIYGAWTSVDGENHKHICSVCSKEETAAHAWNNGIITIEPTTEAEGVRTFTCNACDKTRMESVGKLQQADAESGSNFAVIIIVLAVAVAGGAVLLFIRKKK